MSAKRLLGLDVLRATAIILVLLCHYSTPIYPFFQGVAERAFILFKWLTGFYGVELFFVLSGYLIGTIYFKTLANATQQPLSALWVFVRRRWWRTLPNYYLFVFINILVLICLGGYIENKAVLKSLVFFQKMFPEDSNSFFGVSWSLAVEEWFYLLLPLSFLLFYKLPLKAKSKDSFMLLLLLPSLLKIIFILSHPLYGDYEEVFRFSTFFRLDAIFFGVLLAYIWRIEKIKNFLIIYRQKLLFLGLLLLCFNAAYAFLFLVKPIQNSVLYFLFTPLNALAILACFPYFITMPSTAMSLKLTQRITWISMISYSLYLCHVPIKQVCDYYIYPYVDKASFVQNFGYILLLCALALGLSHLIYHYFEIKILKFRDRILKEDAS